MLIFILIEFFVPFSLMDVSNQKASNSSYYRLLFESLLVVVYGLERCSPPEESLVFRQLKLNDDKLVTNCQSYDRIFTLKLINDHLTDPCLHCSANIVFWQSKAMIALILKANDFSLTKIKRKPKLIQ